MHLRTVKGCNMLPLLLALLTVSSTAYSCEFLADDAKPKGLEERALDSEVVLAAYTRTVYRTQNNTTSYSAEFLVFNILKGEEQVMEIFQKRKPSSLETALNRRLVNASNFGDPTKCQSDVNPGETYILFFDVTADGQLTARYDGVYGPAVVYSRDKEMALEVIGSSPWSEWSPCSGSCGGGIQQRRRQCDGSAKCSIEEGQQRTCNMIACQGTLNALTAANVHRSSLRPSGRPTAYKLLPSGSWRSREEEIIFPRTFPWEFSLLVTVRAKQSSSGGFLLRVLHSGSLQVGLYLSDTITLVLSDKDNIRVSFVKSLFDNHWNQIAFSVRRNTVSFYLNCEFNGKLPLPGKVRPFGGQPATVIVGSTGPQEIDAFQGDVEQITVSGSPDDAEKQCNSSTQPLQLRNFHTNVQEVRSRPFNYATQNDQLPLRGDIIDDEDFSFDENGSGDHSSEDDYDEEYDEEQVKKKSTTTTKDKIPLKSELDEYTNDNDEDYDEEKDEYEIEDTFQEDEEKESPDTKDVNIESKITLDENKEKKEIKNDQPEEAKDEKVEVKDVTDKTMENKTALHEKESELKEEKLDVINVSEEIKSGNENQIVEEKLNEDAIKSNYEDNHPDEEEDEDIGAEGSGDNVIQKFELAWSEWSPCSSTCNWGRRTRTSYCLDNGRNLDSCSEASSKRIETEACFTKLCPTTSSTLQTTVAPGTTADSNVTEAPLSYGILHYKSGCRVKCLNGGTCYTPYKCFCPRGYYGSLCQYAKQICQVKCRNGGTCFPPSSCSCPRGYIGNECQYALCKPRCLNGGTCLSPNKCLCRPGYVGKYCHKPVCQQGCKNGAECIAPNKCACRSGFTGKDCSEPLCDPVCQNGGECVKPFFCHCPVGTKGNFCEKFYCKAECQNGGTCIGPNKCACTRGRTGYNCEKVYCPGGCLNGGTCGKSGKCLCLFGFSGLHCEIRKPCKFKEVKEPYKRGFKQKVATQVKVPCGAWGWKMCTKTKVRYETVYKTFFRTSYECEDQHQPKFPNFQKLRKEQ